MNARSPAAQAVWLAGSVPNMAITTVTNTFRVTFYALLLGCNVLLRCKLAVIFTLFLGIDVYTPTSMHQLS